MHEMMDEVPPRQAAGVQPHQNVSPHQNIQVGSGTLHPLDLKSTNMPLMWKNWITQLKLYLRANGLEAATDSRKVAILLHLIGDASLEIFYSFDVDIDTVTFEDLIKKFESHFTPQANVTMERHRRQGTDESLDEYVTDLSNIGKLCNFKDQEDSLVRDIFSWNLHSNNHYIKERILIKKPKTLNEAVELARSMERSVY